MGTSPLLVKQLIEALARAANESLDHRGFEMMSDHIEKITGQEITRKYLYETYRKVCADIKAGVQEVRNYEEKLDTISKAIGYRRYLDFEKAVTQPVDAQLKPYAGNWWSIVRANAGAYLLKAPVRLYEDEQQMRIELQGGLHLFKGTVTLRAANLFCTLESGKDKSIQLVMKAGAASDPLLLKGVFSGISTAGDPIAGRKLLLREHDLPFGQMHWKKLPLDDTGLDPRIDRYFSHYEKNCIKITQVSTFSMRDLEA